MVVNGRGWHLLSDLYNFHRDAHTSPGGSLTTTRRTWRSPGRWSRTTRGPWRCRRTCLTARTPSTEGVRHDVASISRWVRACRSPAWPRGRAWCSTVVFRRGLSVLAHGAVGAVGSVVTHLAHEFGS